MRPQRTKGCALSAVSTIRGWGLARGSGRDLIGYVATGVLFVFACTGDEITDPCPPGTPYISFPGILTVTEGSTTRFQLRFQGGAPTRVVDGVITPEDESMATTMPKSFRVSPSEYPITVTLYGLDDGKANPTNRGTLLAGYTENCGSDEGNGIVVVDRTIQNVLASDWNLVMAPSSTAMFDVTLTQPPSGTVTVTLNTAPAGIIRTTPTSMTIGPTDYNVGHTVTVTNIGTSQSLAYVGLHPDNGIQSQAVSVNISAGP